MDYDRFFADRLTALRDEGRYRIFAELERRCGDFPHAAFHNDGTPRPVTVWCSNDYLCMGQHPKVIAAMHEALDGCGAGAGGTRNISGTNYLHCKLEHALREWHGKEAALIFTSGYVANLTALSTLAGNLPDCLVLSDAKNHNSMIEGIRSSRAEKALFRHNDVEHLEELLAAQPRDRAKLIAFESVYSMDGDFGPIESVCDLADKYNAMTFLDEVHAVGLYGDTGAGVAQRDRAMERVDVIQGTMGKAFGVLGGYIAGKADLVDFVRSFGNGFIFTTALPPAIAAGARASLEVLRSDEGRALRARHQERAATTKSKLRAAGLPVMDSASHIVPVLVGEAALCKQASDLLLSEHGIYIQPINYPTVPRGTERLRITPSPKHGDAELENLTAALIDIWRRLGLSLREAAE
ncbi:MAG: 5-aminolevulinate synthase [Alphaproteobacteria bacterium]|nr:5-aminolevulinate synthase [Alphaproteobacteria bacterium]